MYKPARLLCSIESKDLRYQPHKLQWRKAGTKCLAQRHALDSGAWVLWFGRAFAVVTTADLPRVIAFEEFKEK